MTTALSGTSLPALAPFFELGSVSLAGSTFAALRDASFETFDLAVEVCAHAFVHPGDAARLRAAGPAILVDGNGEELARAGGPAARIAVPASEKSFFLTRPWHILKLNEIIVGSMRESRIEGELSPAAHVAGHLHLGAGARVLPGVYIEGNVVIGPDCKIGPNCYIRGSTSIGAGCHIGQSVEIKNSVLGRKTNVGHLSYVGDSVLGDGVNFGAGTTTSNLRHDGLTVRTPVLGALEDTGRRKFGAIVGDRVHTGINTSIYPGRKIGAGATTLPAAVVSRDIAA